MTLATPKDKLLSAVVEVALGGGMTGMSLRAIADAAGTSHRMLIHHFGSREGLLVEVTRAVEERQRAVLNELSATATADGAPADLAGQFWRHLRSPGLAPQERLFFELYGQALQGRPWARSLLDGVVDDWTAPVAGMLEAAGAGPADARAAARLSLAVTRGLLLDVLATGDTDGTDAAMRYFTDMLLSRLAAPAGGGEPAA
jgi:AcrR family transcriptional regulator